MYAFSDLQYATSTHEYNMGSPQEPCHPNTGAGSIPVMTWNTSPLSTTTTQVSDAVDSENSPAILDGQDKSTREPDVSSPDSEPAMDKQPEKTHVPKLSTSYWEDERTLCFHVDANGVCVARRQDNDMVNGTKLLNVVGMSRGKRDGILKNEIGRVVVKVGAMHLKGVWITFSRAKALACQFKIDKLLYPLFTDDPSLFFYTPPLPFPSMAHPTNYYPPPPPYYPTHSAQRYPHNYHDMSMVPALSMPHIHSMGPYGGHVSRPNVCNRHVAPQMYVNMETPSPPYPVYQDAYLFDMDQDTPVMPSGVGNRASLPSGMVQHTHLGLSDYAHHVEHGYSSGLSCTSSDSTPATPNAYFQYQPHVSNPVYDPPCHPCSVHQEPPPPPSFNAPSHCSYTGVPEYVSYAHPHIPFYHPPNQNGAFVYEKCFGLSGQSQSLW